MDETGVLAGVWIFCLTVVHQIQHVKTRIIKTRMGIISTVLIALQANIHNAVFETHLSLVQAWIGKRSFGS